MSKTRSMYLYFPKTLSIYISKIKSIYPLIYLYNYLSFYIFIYLDGKSSDFLYQCHKTWTFMVLTTHTFYSIEIILGCTIYVKLLISCENYNQGICEKKNWYINIKCALFIIDSILRKEIYCCHYFYHYHRFHNRD